MAKTLNHNYQANIAILRENLKRGLEPSKALDIIENWRKQFISHNLYGEQEKEFINKCLEEVEEYTHLGVVMM